ncbi:hypothetical protein AArc1_3531 [Natrarchaeobaculum sulfurireducens]|uniref:Uncharacterized protein n=1 Tax=Natrarchaeobaculum sulfurireducens TaxID=2044521 RepID=A0A346PJX8_9EURY|nr:hypothetical protein AArc1_3531 [Natrarchaeobaculum sulfurireducens]
MHSSPETNASRMHELRSNVSGRLQGDALGLSGLWWKQVPVFAGPDGLERFVHVERSAYGG